MFAKFITILSAFCLSLFLFCQFVLLKSNLSKRYILVCSFMLLVLCTLFLFCFDWEGLFLSLHNLFIKNKQFFLSYFVLLFVLVCTYYCVKDSSIYPVFSIIILAPCLSAFYAVLHVGLLTRLYISGICTILVLQGLTFSSKFNEQVASFIFIYFDTIIFQRYLQFCLWVENWISSNKVAQSLAVILFVLVLWLFSLLPLPQVLYLFYFIILNLVCLYVKLRYTILDFSSAKSNSLHSFFKVVSKRLQLLTKTNQFVQIKVSDCSLPFVKKGKLFDPFQLLYKRVHMEARLIRLCLWSVFWSRAHSNLDKSLIVEFDFDLISHMPPPNTQIEWIF